MSIELTAILFYQPTRFWSTDALNKLQHTKTSRLKMILTKQLELKSPKHYFLRAML